MLTIAGEIAIRKIHITGGQDECSALADIIERGLDQTLEAAGIADQEHRWSDCHKNAEALVDMLRGHEK